MNHSLNTRLSSSTHETDVTADNSVFSIGSNIISSWVNALTGWWLSPVTERNDSVPQTVSHSYSWLLGYQEDDSDVEEDGHASQGTIRKQKNSVDEIPSYVECPITLQIYRNPVMLVEAQIVIEEAVVESLTTCPVGPNIGKKLSSKTYFPDIGTKKAVEAYLKRHPEKDNSDDRYLEYPSALSARNLATSQTPTANGENSCHQIFDDNKSGVLFFTVMGGIAVGFYYIMTALPCRYLALKNLTGGPLNFTYSDTSNDDLLSGCTINPWQNVSTETNIHMNRNDIQHCTFYLDSGIKLHTTAFSVRTTGEDVDGCAITAEKTNYKCSWDLFKACPNTEQEELVVEEDQPHYLRGRIGH